MSLSLSTVLLIATGSYLFGRYSSGGTIEKVKIIEKTIHVNDYMKDISPYNPWMIAAKPAEAYRASAPDMCILEPNKNNIEYTVPLIK
jgi:hypothetical protein